MEASVAQELDTMVQPQAGLFSQVTQAPTNPGDAPFYVMCAALDDISQALDSVKASAYGKIVNTNLDGAGSGLESDDIKLKAMAEGLERYSSCAYDDKQFIHASAEELGSTAIDLDTIPRCSEQELAHPRCPISAPDKKKPLRWVRGISLSDGQPVWIPAVMVYMHIPAAMPGERFWLPISTGCATHRSFEQALLGAICEVVERDSISLLWLQKMQLPRLELDVLTPRLQAAIACSSKQFSAIEQHFFDATTDIGIPTIYSLQIAPYNGSTATLVMCHTALDPASCVARVIEESSASRILFQVPVKDEKKQLDDFIDVVDGARYMGQRERLGAFDFLRSTPYRRRLSEMPMLATGDAAEDLRRVVQQLYAQGMQIFAVDISTDEALRAGMRVVRVIIPGLQPLSFSYRARFLAHTRLYSAPQKMGLAVHTEAELNIWPQPFA